MANQEHWRLKARSEENMSIRQKMILPERDRSAESVVADAASSC